MINPEIQTLKASGFSRIDGSNVSHEDKEEVKNLIDTFLLNCEEGIVHGSIMRSKLMRILQKLKPIASIDNFGFLSLAFQGYNTKTQGTELEHHSFATDPLLTSRHHRAKLLKDISSISEEKKEDESNNNVEEHEKFDIVELDGKDYRINKPAVEKALDHIESNPKVISAMVSSVEDLEDIHHAYDDDELEYHEEFEELRVPDELSENVLLEHVTRQERIRRKVAFVKTKAKRERARLIAVKRLSSTPKLTRKARKVAIKLIKERLAHKSLGKLSIQEKERLEDLIRARKQLVNRLAAKLVPKIRKIEQNRLKRKKLREDYFHGLLQEVKLDSDIASAGSTLGRSAHRFADGVKRTLEDGKSNGATLRRVGTINGVHVSIHRNNNMGPSSGEVLVHDDDGNIHHYIGFDMPGKSGGLSSNVMVTSVANANPNIKSPIKMHEVYAQVAKMGTILMSGKEQSVGGLGIWKKLSRMPGINVHAWDMEKNIPVNTDTFLRSTEDTHRTPGETKGDQYEDPRETDDRLGIYKNVRLIAHEKEELNESVLNEIFLMHSSDKFDKYGKEDELYQPASVTHDDILHEKYKHFAREQLGDSHVDYYEKPFNSTNDSMHGKILVHSNDITSHILEYEHQGKARSPDGKKIINISTVVATDGKKPVKMHEVYNHLLDSGHIIVSDNTQSHGGLKVWKSLSRMKGVNVHGWDSKNEIPVNTDRFLRSVDDSHVSPDQTHSMQTGRPNTWVKDKGFVFDNPDDQKEYDSLKHASHHVLLVAHKD